MSLRRLFILLACLLVAPRAGAESVANTRQGKDCQLCYEGASGLELAIPLWLPVVGIEGYTTEGDGSEQSVELDTQLQFAIVAELRLRLGAIGVSLTSNGASLGAHAVQSDSGGAIGQVAIDAYFGRATINWYTPPYRFSQRRRTSLLALWPYMGARYAVLSGQVASQESPVIFEGTTTWGEPLFGIESLLDLRHGWMFRLQADVGGFSVGSQISVGGAIEARYAVTNWLNLRLGWTVYYVRLERRGWQGEMLLQGPGAGLGVSLF